MESLSAHTFFLMLVTLIDLLCIIIVIFVERKNPSSTIAWALVLIFLPFVGFVAYAMFGSGFHVEKKKRYSIKRASDSIFKRILALYIEGRDYRARDAAPDRSRMIRYLENEGGHYYTADNDIHLFTDGEDLFGAMREDMGKARQHIHLLYYIFRHDGLGGEILSLLTEKARNGVEVRLIYDSLGSMLAGDRWFRELRRAGGEVAAFSPLVFTVSSHLRLNYRNHRKITVVDGAVGYMGGMNIGVEYLGRNKRLHPWRDTHLRLAGSSVSFLQERFLLDWMSAVDREMTAEELSRFFPDPQRNGRMGVQIVSSGPDTDINAIKSAFLEMLYSARKNVFIQTPYFTPDDSLFDALRIAARSGVDVRIMLPGLADHLFVYGATYSYARLILDSGVRVFRYNGILHAKTIVFDGEVAGIGTANFDNRSFALNFEIHAFVYDPGFAAACERVFLADQESCSELTESWFLGRPPALRAACNACRLFAPLI
jgi:cardiolipin synthase